MKWKKFKHANEGYYDIGAPGYSPIAYNVPADHADLLSAAPELAKILKYLLSEYDSDHDHSLHLNTAAFEQARAALKKAGIE